MTTISAPETTTPAPRRNRRRLGLATIVAIGLAVATTTGAASAAATNPAEVTCSQAYGTITITPRVVGDHDGQWAATRIWIAKWTNQGWQWQNPTDWKIEQVKGQNNPMGAPIDRLATRTINADGYFYVYTQSALWNASSASWYAMTGTFTTSYTQHEPSVSHEPDRTTTASYCTA